MKILIVEDEDFSRQMLQGYLEKLDHHVVAASDGAEAWRILQTEEFSFVITDWSMPGFDGIELTRRIRSRKSSAYVYIILLTGKSGKKDIVQGLMEGADDFLSKPYDRDELRVRVRAGERILELEQGLKMRNSELETEREKVELANHRMRKDLEAAAEIQRSLLPTAKPGSPAVNFAWIFKPCEELGGDIFNTFQIDQDHVGFYLLDVAGHGVPAALLSVTLSRFLTPTVGASSDLFSDTQDRLLFPNELASELNKRFPMNDWNEKFFTLLFGTFNVVTKELLYTSAGHPAPVYVPTEGTPCILNTKANGFPIGIVDEAEYENERLILSPGDHVVVYSDGLLEAENPKGEFFGKDEILRCVAEGHKSLQHTMRALEERVLSWHDGQSPKDDISVLAIEVLDD